MAIKNGQSRKTGNIGHTRRKQTKQKHTTIFVGHHWTQANTYNENKAGALLQATAVRSNQTSFYEKIVTDITTRNSEQKDTISGSVNSRS